MGLMRPSGCGARIRRNFMKIKYYRFFVALALLAVSILNSHLSKAQAQGTAFTYQGQLTSGTNFAHGSYDMTFSLYNASSGGSLVSGPVTNVAIAVSNGLFTTMIDFGGSFNGTAYWLQIGVRTNNSGAFSPLSPLQEVTPVPYAITAQKLTGSVTLAQLPSTLSLISDPGTQNFFAGQSAGTSNLSGTANTALGSAALSGDTSGSFNTASGSAALANNSSGSANSAYGVDAMLFNDTGYDNTALGAYALIQNQGGYNNTGSGYSALGGNISGDNDTADGANALGGQFISGGGNTGSGAYSIYELTSGYNNTAAGVNALYADSTGVDNIGIGVSTLYTNSTGSQNTAVGTYAFQQMTAGNLNIGLGYHAGYDLISGTNNIYIGSLGSSTDNNVIRIGSGQANTYIDGTIQSDSGDIRLDDNRLLLLNGSDTNNGLTYIASGQPGISYGQGPFLYGFEGGSLGAVLPNTVCLSWDYSGDVWVSNNLSTATLTIRGGSDLAEPFKITSARKAVPQGSVVVIDEENAGRLKVSSKAYDTHVAGVLSGANGVHPGIQMQQQGLLDGGQNVALTGRVYVLADASKGAIKPGDLLTTSDTPGHAMKVWNHSKAQGAILGKAMSGLDHGKGMVLVLVTLQ
jgi:hypothetical protein